MRVEIFSKSSADELRAAINNFIESMRKNGKKILNIHYQVASSTLYSALIEYSI
jgi:ABC-type amino acid transport substrate-binding protein